MNFLNALNKQNDSKLPVWFMRQAGRYLPEYQQLRKQYDFRTMSHKPELIAQTTLTPFDRLDVDAAIMFSDILTCLEYMGAPFEFTEHGPKLDDHGPHVLERLRPLDAPKDMHFVGQGIELSNLSLAKLSDRQDRPLIGFAGAPFTLISYLVEGGTSREFQNTKTVMLEKTQLFENAMAVLTDSVLSYLKFQAQKGAKAVQIFDSWVGVLSLAQYKRHILPHMKHLVSDLRAEGIPVILYSQPTSHLLPALLECKPTALSLDWRTSIRDVVRTIESMKHEVPAIQGNLDPLVTTLAFDEARPYVDEILDDVTRCDLRKQFIFNVGHGVVPETKWETLQRIVNYIHEH